MSGAHCLNLWLYVLMKDGCNHEINNNIQDGIMAFKHSKDRQRDYEVVYLIS